MSGILHNVLQMCINSGRNIHIRTNKIIYISFDNTCVQHYYYRVGNCMVVPYKHNGTDKKTELKIVNKLQYFRKQLL